MKPEVTQRQVKAALGPTIWDLGNEVLYALCRVYPGHREAGIIVAKFWLVGCSYAAANERALVTCRNNDEFYEQSLVERIRTSHLDQWLATFPQTVENPWSALGQVVEVHKRLVDLLCGLTQLNKRSLASQYLHFHRPDLFFLYDSLASKAALSLTPPIQEIHTSGLRNADPEYLAFTHRCQWLRDQVLREFDMALTPRQLDNLLLRRSAKQLEQ